MPFEMAVFSCLLVGVLATGVQKILKPPLYADLPPLTPPKIARPDDPVGRGGEPIQNTSMAVSSPPNCTGTDYIYIKKGE